MRTPYGDLELDCMDAKIGNCIRTSHRVRLSPHLLPVLAFRSFACLLALRSHLGFSLCRCLLLSLRLRLHPLLMLLLGHFLLMLSVSRRNPKVMSQISVRQLGLVPTVER